MMMLLNLFKTQWSGKDMSPDDRRRMFWYLKRRTSYTAWKREADAFDRFANIFEMQVIEEPTPQAAMTIWGTDWESHYAKIVRAQFLYEKALTQLKKGDRTIFLDNSHGILNEASSIAQTWHNELVNHGPQGDHFHDGKYLKILTSAIEKFYDFSRNTGYFQSSMAGGTAPEFWGEWMKEELARVCHLPSYPELLPCNEKHSVWTGEDIQISGIYEPQVRDGCMNYLLAGAPAPLLWGADGSERKLRVKWRLLWRDDRYIDSNIPPEEEGYFLPDNR